MLSDSIEINFGSNSNTVIRALNVTTLCSPTHNIDKSTSLEDWEVCHRYQETLRILYHYDSLGVGGT